MPSGNCHFAHPGLAAPPLCPEREDTGLCAKPHLREHAFQKDISLAGGSVVRASAHGLRVEDSIPGQGMCLRCRLAPQLQSGHVPEQSLWLSRMDLSFPLLPPLPSL